MRCFMIYFIIGFFVLIVLFSLYTRRFRNPWKLYMIFGKKGSGKSSFLVREAVHALSHGVLVYTNMTELNLAGIRYIDPMQLGEFVPVQDSLLILDEVGMLWDNRHFKTFDSRTRDFFKLQRHFHVTCYLASQTWDIDKKIRDLFDGAFLTVNLFGCIAINKRIIRKIVLTEATSEAESRISENLKFAPIWNWKIVWLPRYIKYFDSFVVPDTPDLPFTENHGGAALKAVLRRDVRKQLAELPKVKKMVSNEPPAMVDAAHPAEDVSDQEYFENFFRKKS